MFVLLLENAEVEESATWERQRRETWLRGPNRPRWSPMYYARTAQLAAEGALSLILRTSIRDVYDRLIFAGIDWEDEHTVYRTSATRRKK